LFARLLGFSEPYLLPDQISIIIRTHFLFKETQNEWIKRTQKQSKTFLLTYRLIQSLR